MQYQPTRSIAQHTVIRLRDGRVIAPSAGWRRKVARALLERGEDYGLLAFRLVDNHLHALVTADAPAAAQLARRVEISLQRRRRPAPGFARVYTKPVDTQAHLRNVFDYLLEQESHHGVNTDPLHEGGILPDLLGMRPLGAWATANVRAHLPRVNRRTLLKALGTPTLEGSDRPLDLLAEAAAAAACLPDLRGNQPAAVAARTAAVHVAGDRLTTRALADLVGCSPSSVKRFRQASPREALVSAVRLQLGARRSRLSEAA